MTFTIDDSHVTDIEHRIAPPLSMAITLPVTAQMGARGAEVVLYISTSAFGQRGVPTSARELQAIAAEIAQRLREDQHA